MALLEGAPSNRRATLAYFIFRLVYMRGMVARGVGSPYLLGRVTWGANFLPCNQQTKRKKRTSKIKDRQSQTKN